MFAKLIQKTISLVNTSVPFPDATSSSSDACAPASFGQSGLSASISMLLSLTLGAGSYRRRNWPSVCDRSGVRTFDNVCVLSCCAYPSMVFRLTCSISLSKTTVFLIWYQPNIFNFGIALSRKLISRLFLVKHRVCYRRARESFPTAPFLHLISALHFRATC